MAQSQSNTVKFGLNTNPSFPAPSFKTQTSTPSVIKPKTTARAFPALDSLGVPAVSNGTKPSPLTSTYKAPAVSTATPQFNQGGSQTGDRNAQIESIKTQAGAIQAELNRRNSVGTGTTSSTATNTNGNSNNNQNSNNLKGILDSLLGASKPTKEQERARKEMEKIAAGNRAIGDNARATSEKYGQEISRIGALGAGAVAGNLSTGSNVVGSGNAAIASQSASSRMNALAQGLDAELKGSAQQLTAQEQQANAFNPSLQATLTQQQQQLGGLGTAGGLASPLAIPYSAGGFDPVTGQQIAGGFGGWAGYTTATQVQDLISQYPDAGVQYNPNMSPEQNLQMMQSALGGSNSYQRSTFGAAGANSYIGAQQLGAAGALTQTVAPLQAVGNAADANFNVMLSILQRGGINNLDQPILNQLQQGISRGLTSDADVVAFRSALQTVRSQYAAILGGGSPTDATQAMAAEKIPDTVSAAALQEVEKTMKTMVSNSVAGYNQQIGAYSNQGGGGGSRFAEQW